MLRQIYTITATQVVTSDAQPYGAESPVPGYPKKHDSRGYQAKDGNPNGDSDRALINAQADFADAVKDLTNANNPARVMWTVTLEQANGVQIARKSWGAFPDMTPVPEPEEPAEPAEE